MMPWTKRHRFHMEVSRRTKRLERDTTVYTVTETAVAGTNADADDFVVEEMDAAGSSAGVINAPI
jgi:hypothetical protein